MRQIEKLIVAALAVLVWCYLIGWTKLDGLDSLFLAVGIVGVAHIIFRVVIGIIRPSYLEAEAGIVAATPEEEEFEKELDDEEALE